MFSKMISWVSSFFKKAEPEEKQAGTRPMTREAIKKKATTKKPKGLIKKKPAKKSRTKKD
ncbi:MAG: hypothetical protein CMA64_05450 [Euryarchaeota archaeon]|nr:hypothetical protein [Euryarchaeota archaeon]